MWSFLFDDVGFAKDFFRKTSERQFMRFAPVDPLTTFCFELLSSNHVYNVIGYSDRMTNAERLFLATKRTFQHRQLRPAGHETFAGMARGGKHGVRCLC